MILTGQMSRDEALELLKQPPLTPDVVDQEFLYVSSKLGISTDELKFYHTMPKKYYWDYKNQRHLFTLGEKVLNFFTGARRGGAY